METEKIMANGRQTVIRKLQTQKGDLKMEKKDQIKKEEIKKAVPAKEEIKKDVAKAEPKKGNGKKVVPDKEIKEPKAGSKADHFLKMVRGSGKTGVTMGEVVKAKWNDKGSTFYKAAKRMAARGLLTMKDGRIFAK